MNTESKRLRREPDEVIAQYNDADRRSGPISPLGAIRWSCWLSLNYECGRKGGDRGGLAEQKKQSCREKKVLTGIGLPKLLETKGYRGFSGRQDDFRTGKKS